MQYVPWRYISDWKCNTCGDCCKFYSVVLNFQEWLRIIKNFGIQQTISGFDNLFLKRREDGSCVFLCRYPNSFACGLQYMKPKACQLWPFKILAQPKFGFGREAAYSYDGKQLFIYADTNCSGLKYGMPTWEFSNRTMREFSEIAIGTRINQFKTTAQLNRF